MTTTENISSLLQDLNLVDEDTHQHENQSSSRASCEPREEAGVQGVLHGNLEDNLVLSHPTAPGILAARKCAKLEQASSLGNKDQGVR